MEDEFEHDPNFKVFISDYPWLTQFSKPKAYVMTVLLPSVCRVKCEASKRKRCGRLVFG